MPRSFFRSAPFASLLLFLILPANGRAEERNPEAAQTAQSPKVQDRVPSMIPRAGLPPRSTSTRLQFSPLTGDEKWHYYLRSTYGPGALARSVTWSGINQAMDSNPEWGQGMEGYGKRLGSKFGQQVIRRSIGQGLGAWWHEDPRYWPSERSGLLPRTLHAVTWTFKTRTDDGRIKFADARLIGTFSGALISRTWQPERDRTVSNGLQSGSISVAIDAGLNVFREFWPDIRRRLRH